MVDGLSGAAEFGTDSLKVEVVELHLDEEGIELLGRVQHIQNGICSCSRRRLVVGIGEHHLHVVAEVVIYPDEVGITYIIYAEPPAESGGRDTHMSCQVLAFCSRRICNRNQLIQ